MTNDYGNELLHRVLLSAMKDIDKICRENGLRYYLYAGTLLGAVNYKGFIPWDDDVDIVMFSDDFDKLFDIVERDYSDRYKMMTFENTFDMYSKMSKLKILGTEIIHENGESSSMFVDVNVLHSVPDAKLLRLIQKKQIEWLNLSLGVLSRVIVPSSWKTKYTIALYAKLGKKKLGIQLDRVLKRYDKNKTKQVGIMCNTLTRNPYTGVSGYDTDVTLRTWHENFQYVPFEDTQFMTISNINEYLNWQYGPHWAEPYPEEKRVTKHDVKDYKVESWVLERIES